MSTGTEPRPLPRPELAIDPIAFGLLMMVFPLWRLRHRVARQRQQLQITETVAANAVEANGTLAAHTRLLADELFEAQARLQMEIGLDVDPRLRLDPVWNDLCCENGPLSGRLTPSEDTPKGFDPESRCPCEECPD